MAPYTNGTVEVGLLPSADIDVNANDIFKLLKEELILYGEINIGQWANTADFFYMTLPETLEPARQINSIEFNFDQMIFGMDGLHRILPWLGLGVGGRFVSMRENITISRTELGSTGGTNVQQAEGEANWFGPTLRFGIQILENG